MPFKPISLLIAYDDTRGLCGAVVPRMKQMLEDRAFRVDTFVLGGPRPAGGAPADAPDLEGYAGILVGAPVLRLGLRASTVPASVAAFLESAEALDEKKVAVFSVYTAWPGTMVDALKEKVGERGAECVAEYSYWRMKPEWGEHVVPAECMIRIR